MLEPGTRPLTIAVIGSGISGLSSAWLLSKRHRVTLYERSTRLGGHSNTVDVDIGGRTWPVDTGFIVFNPPAYPNLAALFEHLGLATLATNMTFSVSLEGGRIEYAGGTLQGLLAAPGNLLRPGFWSMLRDIKRFYSDAPRLVEKACAEGMTLGALLADGGFGANFRDEHLLPMAGAIWSAPAAAMLDYPAAAFVRFFENHGLLQVTGRPLWRTVEGGSRRYVERLASELAQQSGEVRLATPVTEVRRDAEGVTVHAAGSPPARFDHVVIAAHADQALAMLPDADGTERDLLGAFQYTTNRTVLHSDPAFMPRRRRAWASWNYTSCLTAAEAAHRAPMVTYWMNRLQGIAAPVPLLVTLNPAVEPDPATVHFETVYEHPVFDLAAMAAQRRLWSLQGRRRTWFCGAHFGAGFHEDGLQAGLAVAEQLGCVRRPWSVARESDRIVLAPLALATDAPPGRDIHEAGAPA